MVFLSVSTPDNPNDLNTPENTYVRDATSVVGIQGVNAFNNQYTLWREGEFVTRGYTIAYEDY